MAKRLACGELRSSVEHHSAVVLAASSHLKVSFRESSIRRDLVRESVKSSCVDDSNEMKRSKTHELETD